jgi:hypothetical protein
MSCNKFGQNKKKYLPMKSCYLYIKDDAQDDEGNECGKEGHDLMNECTMCI